MSGELRQITEDQAICSRCWMQPRKMILKIPSRFPSKVQRWPWKAGRRRLMMIIIIIIHHHLFLKRPFLPRSARPDVFPDMRSLHISLNTTHSGCKPSSSISSFTHSLQVFLKGCILGEYPRGRKIVGCAIPWKQWYSNSEVHSLASWEPVQFNQDWCDMITRFSHDSKEGIAIVKARNNYCRGNYFCNLGGKLGSNVMWSTNLKVWCFACYG